MSIVSIAYKPSDLTKRPDARFSRIQADAVFLEAGYGIQGDVKGGHPKRQLNVMDLETVNALAADGLQTAPGALGEQLVIEGVDVMNLSTGVHIQLGGEAIIELTGPRTSCARLASVQCVPEAITAGRLGVMARVVRSGSIHVGDPVQILVSTSPL